MKAKTIIPLVIGLGVGFFAIKMGIDMVKKAQGAQEGSQAVLVSARTIDAVSRISASMVTTKAVPVSLVPPDVFTSQEALVGRVTKMQIAPGLPITRAMLAPPGAEPGLGARIPPGYRAVSVRVTEESAVAGFITPGCRVDVSSMQGNQVGRSRLILANVEVGAVGQSMSRAGPDGKLARVFKSVTLFLAPNQVQILNSAIGRGQGRVSLAMRGHTEDPGGSLFARLFAQASRSRPRPPKVRVEEPKEKPARAPNLHVVDLRRGVRAERLVFGEDGRIQEVTTTVVPSMAFGGAESGKARVEPETAKSGGDSDSELEAEE